MFNLKKQMRRLLSVSALGSFSLGGALWAVLLAGFALAIGYRAANTLDMIIGGVCLLILLGVEEARPQDRRACEPMLPALFVMGLGGVIGSRLALRIARWRMRSVMLLCAAIIVLGGFLAGMCDDILQVRTDARLNELFPSEQRATILSISSLLFSVVMIVLSPLAGWFFGRL